MSDLAMGPLPAQIKRKDGKTAFRCCIRDCGELLAVSFDSTPNAIEVSIGYESNSSDVFIKTRRAASRRLDERRDRKQLLYAACATPGADIAKAQADHQETKGAAAPSSEKILFSFQLPIVIKCAQCGRLSKIRGAE